MLTQKKRQWLGVKWLATNAVLTESFFEQSGLQ
jgi:hypothetical protein